MPFCSCGRYTPDAAVARAGSIMHVMEVLFLLSWLAGVPLSTDDVDAIVDEEEGISPDAIRCCCGCGCLKEVAEPGTRCSECWELCR